MIDINGLIACFDFCILFCTAAITYTTTDVRGVNGCAYFVALVVSRNIDQPVILLSSELRLDFLSGKVVCRKDGVQLTQGAKMIMFQYHSDNIWHLLLDISLGGINLGHFFHRFVSNLWTWNETKFSFQGIGNLLALPFLELIVNLPSTIVPTRSDTMCICSRAMSLCLNTI